MDYETLILDAINCGLVLKPIAHVADYGEFILQLSKDYELCELSYLPGRHIGGYVPIYSNGILEEYFHLASKDGVTVIPYQLFEAAATGRTEIGEIQIANLYEWR